MRSDPTARLFSLLLRIVTFAMPFLPTCVPILRGQTACGPPPAILKSTAPNIFSEQQEQWLGEAMADYNDRYSSPVRNPQLNSYLNTIGARLLAVLPPTAIKFQFTLVESPEINGFSLAGGHVYLTRKLVASAHGEDEIAGVIAHEMGHILTHQFALETTADLHRLLGIDSVSDRADIYAKYQRLTDARQHQKHQADPDSDDKQDQADRVAVYAAAAAGYRPQAYAEFWDRSFFVGGKTGGHLSDFFGATKPSEKRLRRIRGIIAELPQGCGGATAPVASATFREWQQAVLENQAAPVAAANAGGETASAVAPTAADKSPASAQALEPAVAGAKPADISAKPADGEVQLTPPLRLDIERLRFSRDGKYILAQDESSIFVLTREPFKELFRIDADRAIAAEFTPDSQELVFTTPALHVERWNIARHKLAAAHEVVAQQSCLQMHIAPDGRTIVCVFIVPEHDNDQGDIGFALIDVDTGQVLFKKKPWFTPNYVFEYALFLRQFTNGIDNLLSESISADGNTLLIGSGGDRLAFDLRTRSPIKLGGVLKNQEAPMSYCFLGNDTVAVVNYYAADQSGIYSFPDGKRLKQLKLALPYILSTTGGEYVLTKGPKDAGAQAALADLNLGKYVAASKSTAMDIAGTAWVQENLDGSLILAKLGVEDTKQWQRTQLELSPLAPAKSATLSPSGRYLALSERTRGAVWDIDTGKAAVVVRGFRNGWWSPDGRFLAEFLPHEKSARMVSMITMGATGAAAHASDMTYTLPDKARLEQGHLFEWKQDKKNYNFTASSPFDAKQQWLRGFEGGAMGYTTNYGETDLIFSVPLYTQEARDKLRTEAALREEADPITEKASGRIIELVNSEDGTPRGDVVIEVPRSYEGVDGFSHVGELLYLSTGDNRTIVYSFKTGAQLRQFFGTVISADAKSGIVCAFNRRDELIVMDKAGAELEHRSFGSPLRFAGLREDGTQLVVLTADQKVRRVKIGAR